MSFRDDHAEFMPKTSWWADVLPEEFCDTCRDQQPRMAASRFGKLIGPGVYGERGLDVLTLARQRKAAEERGL